MLPLLLPLLLPLPRSVLGLPLHPLVVHAVVVLLPLSALGLVLLVLVRRWRGPYGPLVLLGLVGSTLAAFLARESGEQLAAQVGRPQMHAQWGDRLPSVALVLLVVAVAWWVLARRGASLAARVLGFVAGAVAVAALALTAYVGHSGAAVTWAARAPDAPSPAVEATPGAVATPATPSPATPPTTVAPPAGGYTLAQVAEHATAVSCWAAINGEVFDLTSWIQEHPGGSNPIRSICGSDASLAFNDEHGADDVANHELARFRIGTLLR